MDKCQVDRSADNGSDSKFRLYIIPIILVVVVIIIIFGTYRVHKHYKNKELVEKL